MTDRQTRDSEPKARALSRLAAIVSDSQDAILAKTLDGIITDWNPSAERLFGFRAVPLDGKRAVGGILLLIGAGLVFRR